MECMPPADFATPMNTLGMGNSGPETDPCVPTAKSKRMKSLKEYIKLKKNKSRKNCIF